MTSRKSTLTALGLLALVSVAATLLAGCPDNGSKPGPTPPASSSAAPVASGAPSSGGGGW